MSATAKFALVDVPRTTAAERFRVLAGNSGRTTATVVSHRTVLVQGPGGEDAGDYRTDPGLAAAVDATLHILRARGRVVEVVPAGTVLMIVPAQFPLYRQGDTVVCPDCAALAEDEDGRPWRGVGPEEGPAQCRHAT